MIFPYSYTCYFFCKCIIYRIFMENESRNKLAIDGWNITQAINCNDDGDFYSYNDDFEEDKQR